MNRQELHAGGSNYSEHDLETVVAGSCSRGFPRFEMHRSAHAWVIRATHRRSHRITLREAREVDDYDEDEDEFA